MVAMHYAPGDSNGALEDPKKICQFRSKARYCPSADHTDIRLFMAEVPENGATFTTVCLPLGELRQFYDFLNLAGVADTVAHRLVRLQVSGRERLRTRTEAIQSLSAVHVVRKAG